MKIALTVNGAPVSREVEARQNLVDFLRYELGLTGSHVGCEHGVCGACTILMNGEAVRSCIMLAAQADGAELMTVEGLAKPSGELHPIQESFRDKHGLQCGFCTPGFLMTTYELLQKHPDADALAAAGRALGGALDPPGDIHGSPALRRHLARVLLARVVSRLAEEGS